VAGLADGQGGPAAGDCDDSWFHVVNISENDADDVIPAGGSVNFTATVRMDDSITADQNDCKNKPLSISWSAN
jgi:hypothetical protein